MPSSSQLLALFCALSVAAAVDVDDLKGKVDPSGWENESERIYNHAATGLNIGAIVLGSLLAFFGYRYKKSAFFTVGFAGVGALAFLLVGDLAAGTSYQAWAPITSFFVGGLIAGGLAAFLLPLGVFTVGAGLGVVISFLLQTAVLHRVQTTPTNLLLYISLGVLGTLFGVLALKLERPLLIIATSYVGSFLATYGVGHFACNLPSPFHIAAAIESRKLDGVPTSWWICLGAIVAAGTAAAAVQFFVTGKKKGTTAEPNEGETYLVLEAGKYNTGRSAGAPNKTGGQLAYN